jgi:hypothetical protein
MINKKFFVSIMWFLMTAIVFFVTITAWNNPLRITGADYWFIDYLFFPILMFFTPALFFAAAIFLNKRKILITTISILLFHIITFFILAALFFRDEGGLGLMYVYGIIEIAFIPAIILGVILRKIIEKNEKILNWLFLIPIALVIILSVHVYTNSTPTASSCEKLNDHGQMYCYSELARQTKNPTWCYALNGYNIIEDCLEEVPDIKKLTVHPSQCQILPNERSMSDCALDIAKKNDEISICEQQQAVDMEKCVYIVAREILDNNNPVDCSTLKDSENKIICYNIWLRYSPMSPDFNQCNEIKNQEERDLCFYSYTINGQGEMFTKVCNLISNKDLQQTCINEVKPVELDW